VEPAGVAHVQEPAGELDERILHQVLGERSVACQEVGQPEGIRCMADVQLRQDAPLEPDRLHVDVHPLLRTFQRIAHRNGVGRSEHRHGVSSADRAQGGTG